MNSLVVLFSVMALVAAKPSTIYQAGVISYAAPALAVAPAAISHQSRLDIKSTPAIISEKIVTPVARTIIAKPAIVAAPSAYIAPAVYPAHAAYVAPLAYTAPAAYPAPLAYTAPAAYPAPAVYSAPIAIAPAAYSTQSRVEVKSSPAIVRTVAAAPLLSAANIAYSAPLAATYPSGFFTPAIAPTAALLKTAEISPVALSSQEVAAPINPELPVAPSETPEVAAARAAHLEAKAFEESHQIQKRSLSYVASAPVLSTYSASPLVSHYASPYLYSSPIVRPLAISKPILPSAYSIHPY